MRLRSKAIDSYNYIYACTFIQNYGQYHQRTCDAAIHFLLMAKTKNINATAVHCTPMYGKTSMLP